jgi:hypothetical protein
MEGYKNNFYIFRVKEKKVRWGFLFQREKNDVSPYEFKEPVIRKRFEMFQGIKIFPGEK